MSHSAIAPCTTVANSPDEQMRVRADLPEAIRATLLPYEHIVWAQRGHGWRWPLVYTGLAILHVGGVALGFYAIFADKPGVILSSGVIIMGLIPFLLGGLLLLHARIVFGPASETYVLTDLRMIHCNAFLNPVVRSLLVTSLTGDSELAITRIAAWGRRDRGWLMLRGDSGRAAGLPFSLHPAVTSLVGVDRPLELAALVKETLKLDFEIEDHTRP